MVVRSQKSEVRSVKSEVRSVKSEVRSLKDDETPITWFRLPTSHFGLRTSDFAPLPYLLLLFSSGSIRFNSPPKRGLDVQKGRSPCCFVDCCDERRLLGAVPRSPARGC